MSLFVFPRVSNILFQQVDETTGKNIYEDATLPNPNDIEFDNLYLDMNGIIHPW
jgi:5'-3' exoribonuclease 2